jgi:hypothetical protein
MRLVLDSVAPVSYALYPTRPRAHPALRAALVGGLVLVGLGAAMLAGYELRSPRSPGAAVAGGTLMNAATGSLMAAPSAGSPGKQMPQLGPLGVPAAAGVVPAAGPAPPAGAGPGVAPAPVVVRPAPRPAHGLAALPRPKAAAAPAAAPAVPAPKGELSDAELQKLLNGE